LDQKYCSILPGFHLIQTKVCVTGFLPTQPTGYTGTSRDGYFFQSKTCKTARWTTLQMWYNWPVAFKGFRFNL